MNKYTVNDIEKGLTYLKKNCQSTYVIIEIDPLGRLLLKGSDLSGNAITITVYNEFATKMPEVSKTERL